MLFHCVRAVHEGGKTEIDNQSVRVAWHKALPLRVFICPSCHVINIGCVGSPRGLGTALLKSGLVGKEAEAVYPLCERVLRLRVSSGSCARIAMIVWELGGLHR